MAVARTGKFAAVSAIVIGGNEEHSVRINRLAIKGQVLNPFTSMAGQIRITPEQMHARAGEFRNAESEYSRVISTMRNLINTLQGEWEGAASESFAAQFESLQPSFNQMDQLILDIAKQCDDVADATQALDEEIASKFK